MEKHDDILKELESISPKLAEIPRKDSFQVQEDYFTRLSETVHQRIHDEQNQGKVIRGHMFGPSTLKWAAAFIVIGILGSGYYYFAWNSFYDRNIATTEAYILENVDEEIITDYFTELPDKANKNKEAIDNSLDNIDEEIIIEGL